MFNIDTSRLFRLLIAGAMGGLVTFFIINPSYAREEMTGISEGNAYVAGLILGGSFAALVAGLLIVADELGSPPRRVLARMAVAAAAGFATGGVSGIIAQYIFSSMLGNAAVGPGSILTLIVARSIGWGIGGAGSGAGTGLALGSLRRVAYCSLGGLLGGLVGGFLFDIVALFTVTGSASRFIGFIAMGAAIGAAIAVVEDLAKQNWVTILSGPKEGRSFILSKPLTTIGRDETADIPLFGDMTVTQRHAALRMEGNSVAIQVGVGALVAVNGAPTHYTQLRDSDVIHIGSIAMRFHQKATQHAAPVSTQHWKQPYVAPPLPQTPVPGQVAIPQPVGRLMLSVTAGPHAGGSFAFDSGPIKIGRDPGCRIALAMDGMVSRAHAELGRARTAWVITDLGSTNGTYVNGARINQQSLAMGDIVSVGQTAMVVEGL